MYYLFIDSSQIQVVFWDNASWTPGRGRSCFLPLLLNHRSLCLRISYSRLFRKCRCFYNLILLFSFQLRRPQASCCRSYRASSSHDLGHCCSRCLRVVFAGVLLFMSSSLDLWFFICIKHSYDANRWCFLCLIFFENKIHKLSELTWKVLNNVHRHTDSRSHSRTKTDTGQKTQHQKISFQLQ